MSDEQVLVPLEERQVDFYGDDIITVLVNVNGKERVYIPIRPICAYLGLSWSGQSERIRRDPVLSEEAQGVRVTRTPDSEATRAGGSQIMLCLPLDFLNGWLFGVNAARVKEEHRDKVIRYQRECYHILAQAFQADESVTPSEEQNAQTSFAALQQIREMGLAIARMAEQQIEIEQRLNTRLDRAAVVVGNINRRLSAVERRLSPPEYVTDDMATAIMLAVKALAEELGQHNQGKNHYQAVYTEIYRRFHAPSYTQIRIDRYEAVMQFLEDWRRSIEKSSRPTLFDEPTQE